MFTYAATSHYWRAIPVQLAEWAWRRRGRSLIERAARSVPAYGGLLRIFGQPAIGIPASDVPALQTCRRSYVQVFPLEQRCRRGWQKQAVSFDAAGTDGEGWPRGRDELCILREQLVSLLRGWFDARQRRTLLVLALPEAGWSSRRRIGQALQEALGLGHLQASVLDCSEGAGASPASVHRLAGGFEQCVVLANPASAVLQALWLANYKGRSGLVSFGPLPAGVAAGLGREIQTCSVLGG